MKKVTNFLMGEYFTDALRNTLAIVFPITIFFFLGNKNAAIGTGVGALLISLTDLPGNRTNKQLTAFLSILVFFIIALVFSLSLTYTWLLAGGFLVMTFLLSMLAVFGGRSGLIGTMAIILSTFIIGLKPSAPLSFSLYVFVGCSWYYLISLLQTWLWPYRSLRHSIFECLKVTAALLRSKTKCYDPEILLEQCYKENIALNIVVSEKQELMRNLLLSDRKALKSGDEKHRQMLAIAQRVIALYEQVTAIHYDYAAIREVLTGTGMLQLIRELILLLAAETDALSQEYLIRRSSQRARETLVNDRITRLKQNARDMDQISSEILNQIITNVEDIGNVLFDLKYPTSDIPLDQHIEATAYLSFLEHQSFGADLLRQHFSFTSPIFRFSLRLALSFFLAYLLTLLMPSGKYSYWMLLTIVIVARPRFGITWKRNNQRLFGTFMGVMLGFFLMLTVNNTTLLLIFAVVFLLGFFAFNRPNYALSVMCITPAVIICMSLLHSYEPTIALERIGYTAAGCVIAFLGLFLFPVWESGRLELQMQQALAANSRYMGVVMARKEGKALEPNAIGLARKDAYSGLAKLSEALQFVLTEPGKHEFDVSYIYRLQQQLYVANAKITAVALADKKRNVIIP